MRIVLAFLLALLLPVTALAADDTQPATTAASAWLKLVDDGNYAQSWSDASKLLQTRIDQNDWASKVKPIRDSLGAVVSRTPSDTQLTKTLPGAPDGEYAIIRFNTKFANKAEAVETVTMSRENGVWKAAGYFIR